MPLIPRGETISFTLAPFSQITLTSGEIIIDISLTISGSGIQYLAISGNYASRIFQLLPGNQLTLEDMTLKNATSINNGGAIFSKGNLTLENVRFQNNFQNGIAKSLTISPDILFKIKERVELKF